MNLALFGATGMVGMGVLLECLDAPGVDSVLVVGRRRCGVAHRKLTEIVVEDVSDLAPARASLVRLDACFYCLGVSAVGMSEEAYRRVTYDLTLKVAKVLLAAAPQMTFLYVSGEGTDSTAQGRVMWARVKGRTENDLLALGFRAAYMLRPGMIQPLRGVRSRTGWYQVFYTVFTPITPVLRKLLPQWVTTTVDLGRAMIRVAAQGHPKRVLRTRDINLLAREKAAPA